MFQAVKKWVWVGQSVIPLFFKKLVHIYTNVEISIFIASQVIKNKVLFAVLSDFTIFVSVFIHKCV